MYERPNVPDASNKYLEKSILTILNFQNCVNGTMHVI